MCMYIYIIFIIDWCQMIHIQKHPRVLDLASVTQIHLQGLTGGCLQGATTRFHLRGRLRKMEAIPGFGDVSINN